MKLYRITDPKNDEDALGGVVGEHNVYVRAYPSPLTGNKHPRDLDVGESSLCKYSLSGSNGTYRVTRLNDTCGTLRNYQTGEALREATEGERDASREAAKRDGGRGVIRVDGANCYVEDS